MENKELYEQSYKPERGWGKWVLIFIGFIALNIVAFFGIQNFSKGEVHQDRVFAQYYERYPNILDPIVKGEAGPLTVSQHYELKSYDDVIAYLSPKDSLIEDEKFYLACSYLEKGDLSNASIYYQQLLNSEKYKHPSIWYLALICIKEKKSKCKKEVANVLLDPLNPYYKKAEELVFKMRYYQD